MELISITGYPVEGSLIAYAAGACLVIRDTMLGEKLILKMDDDGFGRLAKFLASHLTDNAQEETKIHGFRVTMSADRILRVEGSIMPKVGEKIKGDIYLPIDDQLEVLVEAMSAMEGDGHVLWSTEEGPDQLRLVLSHKRGLELNVLADGQEGNSLRLVYVPQDLLDGILSLIQDPGNSTCGFGLSNPWYESDFSIIRDDPALVLARIVVSGHLADDASFVTYKTDFDALMHLYTLVSEYFWG
jgi:hypothetical protein